VVVRVSPPDKDGYVSLGPAADLTQLALEEVKRRGGQIIAEVNPNVPHARGNRIKYDDLTAVIEGKAIPAEKASVTIPVDEAIAANVGRLVPNRRRATIQVGIGNALSGMGGALKDKRKLRIWSELGSDWIRPLLEGDKPKVRDATFSFLLGSTEVMNLANDNPSVRLATNLEVNDPERIAAQKRMRAINTALEVDLNGNVNAERIGEKLISFPGGQPDFMEGAASAKDGLAILALRSRNNNGGSKIVPTLQSDVVTTPKQHVDHVVTEWGATRKLRGLSDAERTYELLRVTHPVLRAELAKEPLTAGVISQAQYDKLVRSVVHSIRRAPVAIRREVAEEALQKGLLSPEEHRQIIAALPAAQAAEPGVMGAH
jgi:acyl-CoA hydrolase